MNDPEEDYLRHNYLERRDRAQRKAMGKPGSKKRAKHDNKMRRKALLRTALALKAVFKRDDNE